MQTNFRGRDLIGDLDFTKEEVETVLDVAWDLKRKRAMGEPHAYLRDKVLAMLFFFSSTRSRHRPARRAWRFHRQQYHPDFARRYAGGNR
jgi:ornithine carbamoyltransferase